VLHAGNYSVHVGTIQPDARSRELTGKTVETFTVVSAAEREV
jgi:hypothetical protein